MTETKQELVEKLLTLEELQKLLKVVELLDLAF